MKTLILEIKQFCRSNYESGYDSCVECWDSSDYAEWIEDHNIASVEDFVKSYACIIERRSEILSTAF